MTDLATRPGADEAPADGIVDADTVEYAWAPPEPAPRRKRLGLWIGIPAGLAAVALVVSSLVLIAPGTSVAGVSVGGLTPGAAADAIDGRLAETTVVLTGAGGDAELTGADLGASVDARALADEAFAQHPMWNPTGWFSEPAAATVTVDADVTADALRAAVPDLYVDPVDATITFDEGSASFVAAADAPGEGIDVATVQAALQNAFDAGQTSIAFEPVAASVPASILLATAEETAASLNAMLDVVGFYVGEERTVPVDRAVAASWLTIAPDGDGGFTVTADPAAIEEVVSTLPGAVDREVVNATVITNQAGDVLSEITPGVTGRTLESTEGIAAAFADQLGGGDGAFALPVAEQPFATNGLARLLEVDLGAQRMYMKENGQVIDSWLVSTGKVGSPTYTGRYTIGWKTPVQTMYGTTRDAQGNATGTYETPNVRWPMYFNGGQAFHGVYWHDNYGTPMSHGCVGMPEWRAQQIYEWAPAGVDVWIY